MSDSADPTAALEVARREGMRLFVLQRGLFATATAGLILIGARGLVAIGWPAPAGQPLLAAGLAIALGGSCLLLALAARARRRMELMGLFTRNVETLELARELVGTSARSPSAVRSWVARAVAAAVVLCALAIGATALVGGDTPLRRHRWTFLDETSDPASLGLRMGVARAGAWTVEPHETATGARALVNRGGDEASPPALLLAGSVRARDLRASTRCKVALDAAGDACGIAFRVVDDRNYHVARLDVAERRIVVAVVNGGAERVLGTASARVERGVWQELAVEARGDAIRAWCNGRDVVDIHDPMPASFGTAGLWAPAAAEAYFDELVVEPLPASAQALEILLIGRGTTG